MKQTRMKKMVNKVLALALVAIMSVGLTVSVGAVGLGTGVTGLEIEKHYKSPAGITPPEELFTFNVEKYMVNNKDAAYFAANPLDVDAPIWVAMPVIDSTVGMVPGKPKELVYAGYGVHTALLPGFDFVGAGNYDFGPVSPDATVVGVDNYIRDILWAENPWSSSIVGSPFDGTFFNFTAAAVYTYKITEIPGTNPDIIYSGAEYWVHINIVNNGSGGFEISGFEIVMTKNQLGQTITPVKPAKIVFENTYAVATDVSISKVVADGPDGTFKGDVNRYFEFEATMTAPSTAPVGTIYKARVYDMSDIPADLKNDTDVLAKNETIAANGTILSDARGDYIAFPSGTQVTFYLKHGQELIFEEVHVGAEYTVNEIGVPNYVPTLDVTSAGATGSPLVTTPVTGTVGDDLSSEEFDFGGTAGGGGAVPVTTSTDRADFENEFDDTPYTGLLVENWPFILMLLAAITVLGVYVGAKSRKRKTA